MDICGGNFLDFSSPMKTLNMVRGGKEIQRGVKRRNSGGKERSVEELATRFVSAAVTFKPSLTGLR